MNRTFDWKIEYIDTLLSNGDCIQSPSFFVEETKSFEFCFKLFPKGVDIDTNKIDLLLCKCDNNSESLVIDYEICMKSGTDKVCDEHSVSFGQTELIKRLLSLPKDTSAYISDSVEENELHILEVKWKITEYVGEFDFYEPVLGNLSCSYEKLLHQGTFSDICLQIGNKVFNVHRFILEARCAVLAKKLQTFEKLETLADPMDFETLFYFLYTGKLNSSSAYERLCTLFKKFESPLLENMTNFQRTAFSVRTMVEMEHYSFVWNIHNFMDVISGEIFSYIIAQGSSSSWIKLKISLDPNKKDSVIIMICSFDNCIKMSIRCITKIYYATSDCKYLCQDKTNLELPMQFEIGDLQQIKEKCLLNNAVKLHVDISIRNGKKFTNIIRNIYEEETYNFKHLIRLRHDFKKIFENSIHSDVVLNVSGVLFPAHKAILSARSPVFASMFQQNTEEKRSSEIIIEGVRPETVSSMLLYMYCGQNEFGDIDDPDLTYVLFIDLYCTARKYNIPILSSHCSLSLKYCVNVQNAGVILAFANTYCEESLKADVLDFVCRNCNKILQTPEWKEVMNSQPKLLTEVSEAVEKFEKIFQLTVNGKTRSFGSNYIT